MSAGTSRLWGLHSRGNTLPAISCRTIQVSKLIDETSELVVLDEEGYLRILGLLITRAHTHIHTYTSTDKPPSYVFCILPCILGLPSVLACPFTHPSAWDLQREARQKSRVAQTPTYKGSRSSTAKEQWTEQGKGYGPHPTGFL